MSSEIHKYIETAIDRKKNLLNAEIIDFTSKLYSVGMAEYNAKVGEWLDSQQ